MKKSLMRNSIRKATERRSTWFDLLRVVVGARDVDEDVHKDKDKDLLEALEEAEEAEDLRQRLGRSPSVLVHHPRVASSAADRTWSRIALAARQAALTRRHQQAAASLWRSLLQAQLLRSRHLKASALLVVVLVIVCRIVLGSRHSKIWVL
jgi:hypothetical protein